MREVEKEIECECDEAPDVHEGTETPESDRQWAAGGYFTHEIVGIGGRVKRKLVKMVPVGAIVKEYEDERMSGKFLGREQEGTNRSWCSWCKHVVPGKKDHPQGQMAGEPLSTTSSQSSTSSR